MEVAGSVAIWPSRRSSALACVCRDSISAAASDRSVAFFSRVCSRSVVAKPRSLRFSAMAAARTSSASAWVLARRLSVVRFAASAIKVAWSAASAASWAASSRASLSRACRTLGADGVLVDLGGVDQQSFRLVVRCAGLGPHRGHLGLDIGPKVIGKVLRPGQQPEGCRAGLFGGRDLVA